MILGYSMRYTNVYEIFEMKDLGETSFVLGVEIHRDRFCGLLGFILEGLH